MGKIKKFLKYNAWLIVLDIVAFNAAYYLALCIRFYVHSQFSSGIGVYLDYYYKFTLYYTVIGLIVFALFRLYDGIWNYAGLNDMNRIIAANAVTALLQILGTRLFIGRMPTSYYLIGAFLQLFITGLTRFSRRFIYMEKQQIVKRKAKTIPAMVIGDSALGRKVVHHLEDNTVYRAVVIGGRNAGMLMDGIPVVTLDSIEKEIQTRGIKAIFIADKELTKEERQKIYQIVSNLKDGGLVLDDFTGYLSNQTGFLPLTNLLEVMEMPITVEVDGQAKQFASAEECLATLPGEYDVLKVKASRLVLKPREQDTSWMETYQEQTGEEVSFF